MPSHHPNSPVNFQAILLDILKDGPQLRVRLQGLHAVLHWGVAVGELGVVVFRNGLE